MTARICPHGAFSVYECKRCSGRGQESVKPISSVDNLNRIIGHQSMEIFRLTQEKKSLLDAAQNAIAELHHGLKAKALDTLLKAIAQTESKP